MYPGCLGIFVHGVSVYASVAGLRAEEDVAIAIHILSKLSGSSPKDMCANILRNRGKLPDCFEEESHYIYPFINIQD